MNETVPDVVIISFRMANIQVKNVSNKCNILSGCQDIQFPKVKDQKTLETCLSRCTGMPALIFNQYYSTRVYKYPYVKERQRF